MLKSLELHCFLKHKHLLIPFTPGLNVLRGANEKGKSSVMEGWAYNWFGAAMLAKSLEETVTWGEKKAGLKTISEFTAPDGNSYRCFRGFSGAELILCLPDGHEEVLVTGQKEVTAKIEQLFGIPVGRAREIVFAEQNAIRGVLAAGPTATAAFVEKLGDFGQADALVKALGEKLDTGSTTPVNEKITALTAERQTLEATGLPYIPKFKEAVDTSAKEVQGAEAAYATIQEAYAKAKETLSGLAQRRSSLMLSISNLRRQRDTYEQDLAGLKPKADQLETLRAEAALLADQQRLFEQQQAYALFQRLPKFEVEWEGDLASLDAEITALSGKFKIQQAALQGLVSDQSKLSGEIRGLKATYITAATCPTCNTQLKDPAVVAEQNAEVDRKIAEIEQKSQVLSQQYEAQAEAATAIQEEIQELAMVRNNGALLKREASLLGGLVSWDEGYVPARPFWNGEVMELNLVDPAKEILRNKRELAAAEAAALKLSALREPDLSQLPSLEAELAQCPDEESARADAEKLGASLAFAHGELNRLKSELDDVKELLAKAETAHAVHKSTLTRVEKDLAENEERLAVLSKNNALMAKVRAARLKVTERLWAHLLQGTSSFFSQFRGEPSIVTKTDGGFTINGCDTRPSGSTMDILGLSLRITVAKMFSNCGVLVLDEPSAGCDNDRTALMTGGLMTTGFDQIILVTHKDVDESAGGNLIQL